MSDDRFPASSALLERARRVVPGGVHGHMAPYFLVPGRYPAFFARGEGAHVWDVDGNRYVDLMGGWGPVVLGHNHPVVDAAARRAAQAGRCLNGPAPVFVELAERLVALTPWAGWAMFAKNGSDVTTWAVQIARAATGRPVVLMAEGAYHGTHLWCSPSPLGVLPEDRAHVASYRFNDLASVDAALDAHDGRVAAIVTSPFRHDAGHDQELPAPGFFAGLRARCDRRGIALVLDDVRAGFRLHMAGSGAAFGFEPDLTCYCKALGNGYPIAAVLGREALRDTAMRVFCTGSTWFGPVEMAAALACLETLAAEDALAHMARMGARLCDGIASAAAAHGVAARVTGPPQMPYLSFDGDDGRHARGRAFAAACIDRGVFLHPAHNWFVSAATGPAEVDQVLEAADAAFAAVAHAPGRW